ncbi:hypothetical protein RC74_04710 [Falsihalocynthiibacter arcticus]|uniref:Uncharacterized protein n=1 Tax=Falsihalocynthiibacter arcticus TaxID=1579316 RepID=A0A126UY91_9RHOB|nr:hypothetical protein RC74_04710 [Falsihalocynthiibacter arcticus]
MGISGHFGHVVALFSRLRWQYSLGASFARGNAKKPETVSHICKFQSQRQSNVPLASRLALA